jgi:PAS domain S-box-containing protein
MDTTESELESLREQVPEPKAQLRHENGTASYTQEAVALPVGLRAEEILANFSEALIVLDSDWRIVYANREAARILGKKTADLLGRTFWEEWPAFVGTVVERQFHSVTEERAPVHFAHLYKSAPETWLEIHAHPCQNGIAIYYRDITELKRTVELQERLAAIVESSDDAIVGKDLNGIIRNWNGGAQRIFGYTAEEIVGKPISTLTAPECIDEIPFILERISRGERVDHYETKRKTRDGRIINVSLTISPIRDASGTIIGASKIARDITERKRHEQLLRELNSALRRSNADLEQFVYSASHDLQEPLRTVATYSEMLRRKFGGQLGEAGDKYIGYTVEGALRMDKLLKDLRAFTHASTLSKQPIEDVNAGHSLEHALAGLHRSINDSGATITHTPLPLVRIHDFQLEQLFQNLIGNAIRYRSSEPPQIDIAAERRYDEWLFSVRDNGIGIEPQYKEQIFGIFQRLHSGAEYPGTGMGLAICQRIVERLGGRIWVESELGRGSTFFFTVPIQ